MKQKNQGVTEEPAHKPAQKQGVIKPLVVIRYLEIAFINIAITGAELAVK